MKGFVYAAKPIGRLMGLIGLCWGAEAAQGATSRVEGVPLSLKATAVSSIPSLSLARTGALRADKVLLRLPGGRTNYTVAHRVGSIYLRAIAIANPWSVFDAENGSIGRHCAAKYANAMLRSDENGDRGAPICVHTCFNLFPLCPLKIPGPFADTKAGTGRSPVHLL
jgi:hypothetical protein